MPTSLPHLFISVAVLPLATVLAQHAPGTAAGAAAAPSGTKASDAGCRLPEPIVSFGAAAHDGAVWVAGGHVGRRHAHSLDNLATRFLRVAADGVDELPAIPPLQGLALVAHEGRLVRVGGMTAHNRAGEPADLHSVADVAAFSPATRSWTDLPPLPEPRSSHDAVVLDDRLYVVGGWTLGGKDRQWLCTCWRLDLRDPAAGWQPIAPLPAARRALAAGVLDGRIWAFGGLDEHGDTTPVVEVYDPVAEAWSDAPELPEDGFGVAVAAHGNTLLVSGRDGAVNAFDGRTYRELCRLAVPRFFHRIVVAGDELWVCGGETAAGHACSIERIPLRSDRVAVATVRVAVPGGARARQSVLAHGGALHVFGGRTAEDVHDFAPESFASAGYRIDLATLAVASAPALPSAAQSAVAATCRGRDGAIGFLLGGFAHRDGRERSLDDVLAIHADAVRPVAARLDVPRTQFAAVPTDHGVLVLGGTDYDADRPRAEAFRFPLDVVRLDPDAAGPAQSIGVTLPRPRRAFGAARLGDEVFLVGGMGPGFAPVQEVDVLDLANGSWRTLPSPAKPRIAPKLVHLGGRLLLVGGTAARGSATADAGADGAADAVEELDPRLGTWRTLGRLAGPTSELQVAQIGSAAVLFRSDAADPSFAFVTVLHAGVEPGPVDLQR